MVSTSQSSWFSSLHTTKSIYPTQSSPFSIVIQKPNSLKPLKKCSFALNNNPNNEFSSNSPEISGEATPDNVKLAFERAREYKKSLNFDKVGEKINDPVGEIVQEVRIDMKKGSEYQEKKGMVGSDTGNGENEGNGDGGKQEVPESVRIAMEKAREYQKNKGALGSGASNVDSEVLTEYGYDEKEVPEADSLEIEKTKEYQKNKGEVSRNGSNEGSEPMPGAGQKQVPEALKIAMEKAKEYKKNKGIVDDNSSSLENLNSTGGSARSLGNEITEINTGKNEELKISSIDFMGLNFADKREGRRLPAGLVPVADPFPEGDLPEVEILVGDASNFENTTPSETETPSEEESVDLYKPKVSTWGVFPRPSNISKTFGGGRNLRPGDTLETPEQRTAKEARTRELLAAYKEKIGLNIDPKLKAECQKALNDGDSLMDVGRLKEALPYYQKVMDKLAFQTELHGLAALQWSICQDSLSRSDKAQVMYEKLQSHPNAQVNKKARQFMFGFQAMEMMKVTRSSVSPRNTGYQKYFEAFVDDKESYGSGEAEMEDGSVAQALPYIIFLASPILIVLLVAASRGI